MTPEEHQPPAIATRANELQARNVIFGFDDADSLRAIYEDPTLRERHIEMLPPTPPRKRGIIETERALAEAKLAEAKLAATKRAVEVTLAEAKPGVKPAVETRVFETRQGDSAKPRLPRYASCDSCGTVNSITRFLDRGKNNWEVRVGFGGADRVFVFPTDPGLAIGERVRYESGRLIGEYPRRTAAL